MTHRDVDYMVQPPAATGARLSQAAYRKHINAALTHGHFQREGGVPATRRYTMIWQSQYLYDIVNNPDRRHTLRKPAEEWDGGEGSYSEGLKLIEPGAVHCLCIYSKGQWGELVDVIDIQF